MHATASWLHHFLFYSSPVHFEPGPPRLFASPSYVEGGLVRALAVSQLPFNAHSCGAPQVTSCLLASPGRRNPGRF
jgi:hypothetical protein